MSFETSSSEPLAVAIPLPEKGQAVTQVPILQSVRLKIPFAMMR